MSGKLRWIAGLAIIALCQLANAATEWSSQDYGLYPGDFDGDGRADLLYVARDPVKPSGILLSDGSGPNAAFQTWPSNYLGIPWSGGQYVPVVADFNHDGRADILLQRATAGDHYLLLSSGEGKVVGITQTISNNAMGLQWSADQHRIVAGDFNGDGFADVFLQATGRGGLNAVILASSPSGMFLSGPAQSWTDSPSPGGFKWSAADAFVYSGDFNRDGRGDLLVQARPQWTLIDYDIPIPVPTHAPNLNGVLFAQSSGTIFSSASMKAWSRNSHGADWSALSSNAVVGDFNGDGYADVMLQGRNAGRASYLLSADGTPNVFASGGTVSSNVPITGDSARLIAVKFGSGPASSLYVQALVPSGTNFVAASVSTSISATAAASPPPGTIGVPNANSATGGSLEGVASVTDGAATYSIPLPVPPGTAGMSPSVSLRYSHQAGDSWLGTGWSIGGMSEIRRCARTIAQDSYAGRVSLDANDRFCLDGERLIAVGGGVYGANNTEYRTEVDTFRKIVSVTTSTAKGPDYFVVYTRSGEILHYGTNGSTTDSVIPAAGISPAVNFKWALGRVQDRRGNYYTVRYNQVPATGEYYPSQISYTGNGGMLPYNAVRFIFAPRPDGIVRYSGGAPQGIAQRLTNVQTFVNIDSAGNGGTLVRNYRVDYLQSVQSNRSVVYAVSVCDPGNVCLPANTFRYQPSDPANNFFTPTMWGGPPVTLTQTTQPQKQSELAQKIVSGDFDGDGRQDIAHSSGTASWNVCLSSGINFVCQIWTAPAIGSQYAVSGDFDGDGKTDIAIPPARTQAAGNAANWSVYLSTGSAFSSQSWAGWTVSGNSSRYVVADFSGDGRSDIGMATTGGFSYWCISTGSAASGFSCTSATGFDTLLGTVDQPARPIFTVADFNGDGRQDILRRISGAGYDAWYALDSGLVSGAGISSGGSTGAYTAVTGGTLAADVNGDGLGSVYATFNTTTTLTGSICRNTGTAFACAALPSAATTAAGKHFADMDGDGRPDMVTPAVGGNTTVCQTGLDQNLQSSVSCAAWTWNGGAVPPTGVVESWGISTVTAKQISPTTILRPVSGPLPSPRSLIALT